jgi:hydrogenase-4 membrane subunit HyfE
LALHLLAHEGVPKFLDKELVSHFNFGGVLVFVGSGFSDVLITLLTLDSSLNGLFFVLDAFLELDNSVLAILLLFLNVFHELVEDALALEFLFLGHALLLDLVFNNRTFAL